MEERRKSVRRQHDRALLESARATMASRDEDAGKEARKRRRWAIRHNCAVQVALEHGERRGMSDTWSTVAHAVKGRILDLSPEGCSLFTRDSLEMGQRARLELALGKHGKVNVRGVARWSKAIPDRGGYATGIQFESLLAKEQGCMQRFLKEMDDTVGL